MKSSKLKDFQIVVIGPQGSGKGTQSSLLGSRYGFIHVPLGDILKSNILEENEEIATRIKKGELLTDEEVFSILEPYLTKFKDRGVSNFIFDGVPRTVSQVLKLKKLLGKLGFSKRLLYIFLEVDDATTVERISKRRVCIRCKKISYPKEKNYREGRCSNCGEKLVIREDDKEEAVRKRLKLFHEKTEKLTEGLLAEDQLIKINGKASIDEVFAEIVKKLDSLNTLK